MNKKKLLETATKNGWECQWRPEGTVRYRLSGTTHDGIEWEMESAGVQTKWKTVSVLLEQEQFIELSQHKPRNPYSLTHLITGFFFRRAMQKILDEASKADSPDDEPGVMYDLELQSSVLKENHYKLFVLELDERSVRRIIDSEVEQAVLSYFTGPGRSRFNESTLASVSIGWEQATINANSHLVEVPAIEQFIELGLTVARKARRSKTP